MHFLFETGKPGTGNTILKLKHRIFNQLSSYIDKFENKIGQVLKSGAFGTID